MGNVQGAILGSLLLLLLSFLDETALLGIENARLVSILLVSSHKSRFLPCYVSLGSFYTLI